MRRTLVLAVVAGFAGLAFASPASAVPSPTTTQLGETDAASGVIQIGRDRNWRNRNYDRRYRGHYGYGYGYGYRPYSRYSYRPYPYYRPYAHYGYPYGYGRPGISFGFAF
jgi:hypothetical protein